MANEVEIRIQGTLDLGDVESGLDKVKEASTGAGTELENTGKQGEEAGKKLHEAGEHGNEFGGILSKMTGILGQTNSGLGEVAKTSQEVVGEAGGAGFLGAAGAALIAVGAFVKLGMEGGNLATELMQLAETTGMTIEKADFWSKAFEDVGGSASSLIRVNRQLSSQIEQINTAMEANNPLNEKQSKLYNLLGGKIHDANGELLTGGALIEKAIPALAQMTDTQERARQGTALFGRAWGQIAPLVANYTEVSEKAEKQSERLAKVMGTDVEHAAIAYNTKMTDIKTSMEILEMQALPPVIDLLGGLANALEKIINMGTIAINFSVSGLDKLDNILEKLTGGSNLAHQFVDGFLNAAIPGKAGLSWLMSDNNDDVKGKAHGKEAGLGEYGPGNAEGAKNAAQEYNKHLKEEEEQKKKNIKALTEQAKAEEEWIKQQKELVEALKKGSVDMEMAKKNHFITTDQFYGAGGRQEAAKETGVLEGHAAITEALSKEQEVTFDYIQTLSKVAEMYKENQSAAEDYVRTLQDEAKAKIDAAMSEVFGKGTQEQARMALNIDRLSLNIERLNNNKSGGGGYTLEGPSGRNMPVESLQQAVDYIRRLGYEAHVNAGGQTMTMPKGWDIIVGKNEANATKLGYDLKDLEGKLRESQLNSKVRQDVIAANDKSRPTDAEQARMARDLATWTANTTGEMRKLSTMSGTDLFKSFGAARDASNLASDASRTLGDKALRENLIPKAYDAASAFDAIVAAANSKSGAAAELERLRESAGNAANELDKVKAPEGGGGGGGSGSSGPANFIGGGFAGQGAGKAGSGAASMGSQVGNQFRKFGF